MKFDKIYQNRISSTRGDPYGLFKKKVLDALYLERKIMMMKLGKKEQYQARMQYVVFLVSCLEYYLQEIFKKTVDEGIISIQEINKHKNMKSIKLNLDDLKEINENRIKVSEIIADKINFQNIRDIGFFCELILPEKKLNKIIKRKKDVKFPQLKGIMENPSKMKTPSMEKKFTQLILEGFFELTSDIKNKDDITNMLGMLVIMLRLRHKIVHRAQRVHIKNSEALVYTMVTMRLAFLVNEGYKMEKK